MRNMYSELFVTNFSSHNFRCKGTTNIWNMQIFVRFFEKFEFFKIVTSMGQRVVCVK